MGMYDLSRAVGMGSRTQVQCFLRIFSMWLCLMPVKWRRDGKLPDRGSMTGGDSEEELDIREQMLLTLACSSVASIGEDDCGFRR